MKYHFKIHQEAPSYWAQCLELEVCLTQADSLPELYANMEEALNLYLNEPENSKLTFPLPLTKVKKQPDITQVPVNAKVAFALLLKQARQEKNISQTAMANLLKHNSVFSYQKLESSRFANPTLLKVHQLKEILPNLRLDLLPA